MKLKTLIDNPSLFVSIKHLLMDLAGVVEQKPDGYFQGTISSANDLKADAGEIIEKWEKLDK